MFDFYQVLGPFAGLLTTIVMSFPAAAQDCPDLAGVHDLLPRIDDQLSGPDALAYTDGPLESGKSGYGFILKKPLFRALTCKANTLFRDRKIVLNCAVPTPTKARADEIAKDVLGCLLEKGWGQRGIYLIDPKNDITLAKLYALENSFSIEFVQNKSAARSGLSDAP